MVTELLRENKRALDKSIREIERERQNLQNQEKKLIMEIKKTAKQGQMVGFDFMALDGLSSRVERKEGSFFCFFNTNSPAIEVFMLLYVLESGSGRVQPYMVCGLTLGCRCASW